MRTEAILLIRCNCLRIWWPGTELNRRRQPFQGCALPPELPGHFPSAHRHPHRFVHKTAGGRLGRAPCALTGREAARQNSQCAGTVRNYRIITTVCRPLKMDAVDFRRAFLLALLAAFCPVPYQDEGWPLGTPFMIASR